jgi:hypothetical protein
MSSLDEISFTLGSMSSDIKTLLERDAKRERQMTDVQASLGEVKTRMKPIAEDVKFMKPHVRHYAGVRRFAAFVVTGVATASAAVGGFATHFIEKKFFS